MRSFEVHSNDSACRKSGRLGMDQVQRGIEDRKNEIIGDVIVDSVSIASTAQIDDDE